MIYISGKNQSFEIKTFPDESGAWYINEIGKPEVVSRTIKVDEQYIIYLPNGEVLDTVTAELMRNPTELHLWMADRFKHRIDKNYQINFPDDYWVVRRRRRSR